MGGDDTLKGESGTDWLRGHEGDDRIETGPSGFTELASYVSAGPGNDLVLGGAWPDHIDGGEGNDLIRGSAGADQIYGKAGDDEIHGGYGNDWIDGYEGVDRIYGDQNNDRLTADFLHAPPTGETGQIVVGGSGIDRCDGGAAPAELSCEQTTGP